MCVSDPPVEFNTAITAKSLTTPSLSVGTPFGPITPQSFASDFPGWKKLPVNSRDIAVSNSMRTLSTYLAAYSDAEKQIAAIHGQPSALATLQIIAQLLADQIEIQAVANAEQLNERTRAMATDASGYAQGE